MDPGTIDSDRLRLRTGLGLCEGVIFDQHFLKRQRQNRMFAAILKHPELIGLGVDEGTGLIVEDGRLATVIGEKVMRVEAVSGRRSLGVDLYQDGESFDLFSGMAEVSREQAAS
jgi:cyanophycinase